MPADHIVLCVSAYVVMKPPKLQPLSSTREPSTYGCDVSHFSPSSRSRNSSSPKFLYTGHADSAPLPLPVRLSRTQTMIPCWARYWCQRYVAPNHWLRTCCACGPEYVCSKTGYLRDGSKSGGRNITPSSTKPSRARTCTNSGLLMRKSRNAATSFASTTRTSVPSLRASEMRVGVWMSVHESIQSDIDGLNDAMWFPATSEMRFKPEPSSATR